MNVALSIRRRITGIDREHWRILSGAAWVAAFVVVGRLAGAGKEIAIAWRYGVSGTVDAYQLATVLVFWLPGTLVSALSIVLVPMLIRLRQQSSPDRYLFVSELEGTAIVAGAILALVSLLIAAIGLHYMTAGLEAGSVERAKLLTAAMSCLAPAAVLVGLYAARLMAQERQINTLLEAVPAVTILASVLLWPRTNELAPLLCGTLLGLAVHCACARHFAKDGAQVALAPAFSHRARCWPELYHAIAVLLLGQVLMSFVTPLDQWTAARFGDGAIAALGYSNRVIALLLGAGAVAISRATLPVIADLQAEGKPDRARRISRQWAVLTAALGVLIAAPAWALAPAGISLLFERGAFTPQDTRIVSELLRWNLVQVPFFFASLVLVQQLASQGRYRTIAWLSASNLLIKCILNWTLPVTMGICGIALATGLMYAWSAGCLYYCALHRSTLQVKP